MAIDYTDMPDAPQVRGKKCCGKCAFRKGSQERDDGYLWAQMAEAFKDGDTFFCHESIPGHHQEEPDGPRWQTCAGYEAHKATNFANIMRPVGVSGKGETVLLPEGFECIIG